MENSYFYKIKQNHGLSYSDNEIKRARERASIPFCKKSS